MKPPADAAMAPGQSAPPCPVCERWSEPLAVATVLRRHQVRYFRCPGCGFTFTEKPFWLHEAYTSGMSVLDLGPVHRCIEGSEMTRALLLTHFDHRARCVDYGAGYGIFVRRMRDLGFDFHYHDKYPTNLFAKGFETVEESGYELLTAFEVFEHLTDPLADVRTMLRFSRNIFFSTLLMPWNRPKPDEWWYFGLEHGQHVSLHTHRSLSVLAERFGLKLVSDGNLFHLLTEKSISGRVFRLIIDSRIRTPLGAALTRVRRVRSKLPADFAKVFGPLAAR